MKMIVTVFVVFAVASSALGECPVPPTVPGADISKIAGRWYEISGSQLGGPQERVTCLTQDFTPREDGDFNFTMLGTQHDGSMNIEQLLAIRTGSQNSFDLNDMAKRLPYQVTLYVADTDYDNYLATYSCVHIPGYSNIIYGWVLSRTNTMNDEKYAELNDLLVNKVGVPSDRFGPIIQKDCKYWPISPQ